MLLFCVSLQTVVGSILQTSNAIFCFTVPFCSVQNVSYGKYDINARKIVSGTNITLTCDEEFIIPATQSLSADLTCLDTGKMSMEVDCVQSNTVCNKLR